MFKLAKELLPPHTLAGEFQRIVGVEPRGDRHSNEADLIVASADKDGTKTYIETIRVDFAPPTGGSTTSLGAPTSPQPKVGERTPLCTLNNRYDIVHCSVGSDRDVLCFTERVPHRASSTSTRSFTVVDKNSSSGRPHDSSSHPRPHPNNHYHPPAQDGSPNANTISNSAPTERSSLRECSPSPQPTNPLSTQNTTPPAATAITSGVGSPGAFSSVPNRSFEGSEDVITLASSAPMGNENDGLNTTDPSAVVFESQPPPVGTLRRSESMGDALHQQSSLGGRMPSMTGVPNEAFQQYVRDTARNGAPPETFDYKLHIVHLRTAAPPRVRDVTMLSTESSSKRRHTPIPGCYIAGYCIPKASGVNGSSKDRSVHIIRAVDQRQIDILTVYKEGSGFRASSSERIEVYVVLATPSLWHHWNPFTRQFSFMVFQNKSYCLRITDFQNGAEKRQSAFQITTASFRKIVFTKTLRDPFIAGHSTPNAAVNITVLKTSYECCHLEDYALCHQHLGDTSKSTKQKRVIFTVSMLRTLKYVDVVVDTSLIPTPQDYRVSFLYMHGMIIVMLPGGFIHYVDVSHRERGPTSLFTIHIPHDFPSRQYAVLPTPTGSDWFFVPNTLTVVKAELSQYRMWNCVMHMLREGGDTKAIKHAVHVATTHFPRAMRTQDTTRSNISRLLEQGHRLLASDVITELVLGEAYNSTRAALLEKNDYWSSIPMTDERKGDLDDTAEHSGSGGQTAGRLHKEHQPMLAVESRERSFSTQETQNTLQDWFIPANSRRDRGGSFFKKIFNSKAKATPIERFTFSPLGFLTEGISSTSQSVQPQVIFRNSVANQLKAVGVPKEEAPSVASCYLDELSKAITMLLQVIANPRSRQEIREPQLHVLLNLCVALDVLGFPLTKDLVEHLTRKGSRLLPKGVFLEGVKSGVFQPTIEDCVNAFGVKVEGPEDKCDEQIGATTTPNRQVRSSTVALSARSTASTAFSPVISLAQFSPAELLSSAERQQRSSMPLDKSEVMSNTTTLRSSSWSAPPVMSGESLEVLFTTNVLGASNDSHERKLEAVTTYDPAAVLQMYRKQLPDKWPKCHYPPLKLWVQKCEDDDQRRKATQRKAKGTSIIPSFVGGAQPSLNEDAARISQELNKRARAAKVMAKLYHPFNSSHADRSTGGQE